MSSKFPPTHLYYHPKHCNNESAGGCRRAVVVTGCDSGFGRDIALSAAKQGFVVFAGCLTVSTSGPSMTQEFRQNENDHGGDLHPFQLDVTSDADCQLAVSLVENWLRDENGDRRMLHAIVNNAGIGVIGEVDWISMESFHRVMNGAC
jgi:NAD(P)-dependent dehydrogenase (short-subunit alcohol dehydrogenase family)